MKNGLWLLPSRRRPEKLAKLFAKMKATSMTTRGVVLIQEDEWRELINTYLALERPENWDFELTESEGLAAKVQEAWASELCDGAEWVGVIADDNSPETQNWDTILVERLQPGRFVCSNDGWQSPNRIHGALVFSRELLEATGWLAPPNMIHLFFDDVWETIGKDTGTLIWAMDVMVAHKHAKAHSDADDTMLKINTYWKHDEQVCNKWLREDRNECVERVLTMLGQHGSTVIRPDFSGLSVMIATPCMKGSYERTYMLSLIRTAEMLKQYGATVDFADLPYSSDLILARNKIFGRFLRSANTHLLMIDDDMGWESKDVARLLMMKQPFVAVAGPGKGNPIKYAVNYSDEYGRALPLKFNPTLSAVEASEVGAAFVLIDHSCAERMSQSYADLKFLTIDGHEEYGVYNPIVEHERYYAEDFAFCLRWRKIGGKVMVVVDIVLSHTGSYTWQGCFADFLAKQAKEIKERLDAA